MRQDYAGIMLDNKSEHSITVIFMPGYCWVCLKLGNFIAGSLLQNFHNTSQCQKYAGTNSHVTS